MDYVLIYSMYDEHGCIACTSSIMAWEDVLEQA